MGIMQLLIEQSRMPSGVLGKIMLRIMNNAHRSLTEWGLSAVEPGDVFLDVSCGGGNAVSLIAQQNKFKMIHGIDISPEAISTAVEKNQEYIQNGLVRIQQASVLDIPFKDDYFDAITTFQSHYHWPDVMAAMKEIYRILKPGGQFVLVAELYKIECHMSEYNSAEKTKTLLKESGFINIRLHQTPKCIRVIGYK